LIYPLLGVNAFSVIEPANRHTESDSSLLYLKGPDTEATGKLTTQGFLVLKGSTGRITPVASYKPYRLKLRDKLIENGVLAPHDGKLVMQEDYPFNSASEAGAILMGRGGVGPGYWRDAHGRTLKSIQSSQSESDESVEI
jgi:hypothetical protein